MDITIDHLWQPDGWCADVSSTVAAGATARLHARWAVPGVANIHSHAFQRAMAGLAERRGDPNDSFWTWRELMYALASRIDPEALQAIATMLYAEMLEAGFTTVCEFHYLHNDPDGRPYADPAELSLALIRAARDSGIRLVLLPTLYQTGGFDGRALTPRQRRFGLDTDAYLRLHDRLQRERGDGVDVGVAFHSLRAVPEQAMRDVLQAIDAHTPVHLHISEQVAEVDECVALRGARPVAWLLDRMPVDARWCLVHATHVDPAETTGIARSGATVALCPTTEANLGDGIFPLAGFRAAGGRWGIGSDSHVSVSLVEELRWLEYGQRLFSQRRNIAADAHQPSCGETLFADAFGGGRAASGGSARAPAEPLADLAVLDDCAVELAHRSLDQVLDTLVFAGNRRLVRDVLVGNRWQVRNGAHVRRDPIERAYRDALQRMLA